MFSSFKKTVSGVMVLVFIFTNSVYAAPGALRAPMAGDKDFIDTQNESQQPGIPSIYKITDPGIMKKNILRMLREDGVRITWAEEMADQIPEAQGQIESLLGKGYGNHELLVYVWIAFKNGIIDEAKVVTDDENSLLKIGKTVVILEEYNYASFMSGIERFRSVGAAVVGFAGSKGLTSETISSSILQAAVIGDETAYQAIKSMPVEEVIAYLEGDIEKTMSKLPEGLFGFGLGYDVRGNAIPIVKNIDKDILASYNFRIHGLLWDYLIEKTGLSEQALAKQITEEKKKRIGKQQIRKIKNNVNALLNMTPENLYAIGKLLGLAYADKGDRVAVTGDGRLHTPIFRYFLALGAASVGVDVDFSEESLTSGAHNVYAAENPNKYKWQTQISGSHGVYQKNGAKIKIDFGNGSLDPFFGKDLDNIYRHRAEILAKANDRSDTIGRVSEIEGIGDTVVDLYNENLPQMTKDEMLVIDTRAGNAGPINKKFLEKRGFEIVDVDEVLGVKGIPDADIASLIQKDGSKILERLNSIWKSKKHQIAFMINMHPDPYMRRGIWDPSQPVALIPTKNLINLINSNLEKGMPEAIGGVYDGDADRFTAIKENGDAVPAFEMTLPYYQRFLLDPKNKDAIIKIAKAGGDPLWLACDVRANSTLEKLIAKINKIMQEESGIKDRKLLQGMYINTGYPPQISFVEYRIREMKNFVDNTPSLKKDSVFMENFRHLCRTYYTAEASGHNFFHVSTNNPERPCDCGLSAFVSLVNIKETIGDVEAPYLDMGQKQDYRITDLFETFPSDYTSSEIRVDIPNSIKIKTATELGRWLKDTFGLDLRETNAGEILRIGNMILQPVEHGFIEVAGFKAQFKDGRSVLIRWSNTGEQLNLIFEGYGMNSLIGLMEKVYNQAKNYEKDGLDLENFTNDIEKQKRRRKDQTFVSLKRQQAEYAEKNELWIFAYKRLVELRDFLERQDMTPDPDLSDRIEAARENALEQASPLGRLAMDGSTVFLDGVSEAIIDELPDRMRRDGQAGVTTNGSILQYLFAKELEPKIRGLSSEGNRFVDDIYYAIVELLGKKALERLLPARRSGQLSSFSVEVPSHLDTPEEIVEAAVYLRDILCSQDPELGDVLTIKVPNTEAGREAVTRLIAEYRIQPNITLVFSSYKDNRALGVAVAKGLVLMVKKLRDEGYDDEEIMPILMNWETWISDFFTRIMTALFKDEKVIERIKKAETADEKMRLLMLVIDSATAFFKSSELVFIEGLRSVEGFSDLESLGFSLPTQLYASTGDKEVAIDSDLVKAMTTGKGAVKIDNLAKVLLIKGKSDLYTYLGFHVMRPNRERTINTIPGPIYYAMSEGRAATPDIVPAMRMNEAEAVLIALRQEFGIDDDRWEKLAKDLLEQGIKGEKGFIKAEQDLRIGILKIAIDEAIKRKDFDHALRLIEGVIIPGVTSEEQMRDIMTLYSNIQVPEQEILRAADLYHKKREGGIRPEILVYLKYYYFERLKMKIEELDRASVLLKIASWEALGHEEIPYVVGGQKGYPIDEALLDNINKGKIVVLRLGLPSGKYYLWAEEKATDKVLKWIVKGWTGYPGIYVIKDGVAQAKQIKVPRDVIYEKIKAGNPALTWKREKAAKGDYGRELYYNPELEPKFKEMKGIIDAMVKQGDVKMALDLLSETIRSIKEKEIELPPYIKLREEIIRIFQETEDLDGYKETHKNAAGSSV